LPSGLPKADHGRVDGGLPAVLERADAAAALPRLGGMARPNGVVVVSERYWAFAGCDGSLRGGRMPQPRPVVRHVPLVRGLVRLGASVSPLFRRTGVARPLERRALLAAVLAPCLTFFLPSPFGLLAGIGVTLGLVLWMLRGRTLHLHGAEHRAIAAAEERRLGASWRGEARPSRFSPRCGTNFAALVVPVTLLFDRLWMLPTAALTPLAVTLVSLALTMELWQLVQSSQRRAARIPLLPGLALQRLTTREPSLDETRVALRAVAAVLERELAGA
jgi:Protein of unknown function (DUF1385)